MPATSKRSCSTTIYGDSALSRYGTPGSELRSMLDAAGIPRLALASVGGRQVGVAVANDGSLFVAEDGNGAIWRVEKPSR